ncbi:glutamate receptor 3.1-like isoform X2 [Apium graveolens]|uniref:glutamate receptor 3.1-like isoform X2 n=1 Tax=Apium graveolens TaxID=4045 RepID=UPI003D7A49DF
MIFSHSLKKSSNIGAPCEYPTKNWNAGLVSISLSFPERNMVASKWSKFVLVIWLFTAYIVMQSYTANSSSNLTVSRLHRPTNKLYCIGFQDGSFVKEMLTKRLDFNVSKIKSYASVEQYHDALFKGCHNGGVDAILDELPFIKIFLDTYGETNYKLQGSSYKTGGIGFAFPKGSALAPHISLALLNLTGSGEMHAIMSKNFGPEYSDSDYSFNSSSQVSSIGTKSLAGLFIISGSMAILALVFSAPWFHQRFSYVSTHYKLSCVYPSPSSDVIDLSVQSALEIRVECPPLLLLRTHSLCQLGAKRTVLLMMRLAKMILTPVQPDPVFTAITRSLQQI